MQNFFAILIGLLLLLCLIGYELAIFALPVVGLYRADAYTFVLGCLLCIERMIRYFAEKAAQEK